MKTVSLASLSPRQRLNNARPGAYDFFQLLEGDEHRLDNYSLQLVRTYGDFRSPRHSHNFDQVRVQLEGTCDFDRDGSMKVGSVSYFPESTPYGPQTNPGESFILLLQFGGASGNGYISEQTYDRAVAEMKEVGSFTDGYYAAPGIARRDAFQAVWEHVNKRPINYAPRRYATPAFMNPPAFQSRPVVDAPGVSMKTLGVFTEREVGLRIAELEPKSILAAPGPAIGFVMSGEGQCNAQPLARYSAIELNPGDTAALQADSAMELLLISLPPIDAATAASAS